MNRTEKPLKNRAGLEMGHDEIQDFLDKSEGHEFERQVMFSPKDESMSDKQMEEATRDAIQSYFEGETVDYCYVIHRDKPEKGPDIHVALTGKTDDLYMNKTDLNDLREVSEPIFEEKAQTIEKEILRENGLEKEEQEQRERTRRKRALEQKILRQ